MNKTYKNKRTGALIETPSIIYGEDWECIEPVESIDEYKNQKNTVKSKITKMTQVKK